MCPKRKRCSKIQIHSGFNDEGFHDATESGKFLRCMNKRSGHRRFRYRAGQEGCINDCLNMTPGQSSINSRSSSFSQISDSEDFLNGLRNLHSLIRGLIDALDNIATPPQVEGGAQQQGYGNDDLQYMKKDSPQDSETSVVSIQEIFNGYSKNAPVSQNYADISDIRIRRGNNFNVPLSSMNETENQQENLAYTLNSKDHICRDSFRRRRFSEMLKTSNDVPVSNLQGRTSRKGQFLPTCEIKESEENCQLPTPNCNEWTHQNFHSRVKLEPPVNRCEEPFSKIQDKISRNSQLGPIPEIQDTVQDPQVPRHNCNEWTHKDFRRRVPLEPSRTRYEMHASKIQGRINSVSPRETVETDTKKPNLQSYPSKEGTRSFQIPSVRPKTPQTKSASQRLGVKNHQLPSSIREIRNTQELIGALNNRQTRPQYLKSVFDKAAMNQTGGSERNQQGAENDSECVTISIPLMLELSIDQDGNVTEISDIKSLEGHPAMEHSKSGAPRRRNGEDGDQKENQHFSRPPNQPKNENMKHSKSCQCKECPLFVESIRCYSF